MGLNIGPWIVAVDPGTLSLGVCVSKPDGEVQKTYSVRPLAGPIDTRLRFIRGGVSQVFDEAVRSAPVGSGIELTIEDGVYRARPKVCSMLGEVRGVVMAEAFRRGWPVRRMVPLAWKNMLTKSERLMKKDKAYVVYWNSVLSLGCRTPDEIDAVHIARKAVAGRR